MKCKYCGETIKYVHVRETFIKRLDDVRDEKDFFAYYDSYDEATVHCPKCGEQLDETELVNRNEDYNELYELLEKKHKETDWSNLLSIKAYNEYARQLRNEYEWNKD